MRQILILLLILSCSSLFAQTGKSQLMGSWIKSKVEYKDGEELPDGEALKYSYLRYHFEAPNKAYVALAYNDRGTAMTFHTNSNVLELKNSFGFVSNSFLVEKQSADELVLLQMAQGGFESPDCLRYYFVSEESFQKSIALKPSDILSINGTDTLYDSSPRVYARYKGDSSFHDYLTANIPAYKGVVASDNFFLATFIIRKSGEVDSLQVLEGISPTFDKQFVKAFNKAKGKWQPATIGGRSVDVRMQEQFRFVSSDNFLPSYDYSNKGKEAMRAKEYLKAIHYFDRGLEKLPTNSDMLYQRAVCKLQLGNRIAACEDLQKVKALGKKTADVLIEKTCN
jgi:tetratricopeptide (TPR) repeat protein